MSITHTCPKTEYSEKFIDGMLNRMEVSFQRYGALKDGFPFKVSAIKTLELKLRKYKEEKNLEHLIDLANYAMIEFMHPSLEGAYFEATDSNGSTGRVWHHGAANRKTNDK